MDIMNDLPEEQFNDIDDLLAFISIYEDENRSLAYFNMLDAHADLIQHKICVEAGCGYGLMAEHMAKMGAKKVYAVEANPYLFDIAKKRLSVYENIQVVHADIRDFKPDDSIDLLVHEFFGQLVLDEDLYVLDQLACSPTRIMPNRAVLKMSLFHHDELTDDIVTDDVLNRLKGTLVSGLFEDEGIIPQQTILEWQPGRKEFHTTVDLSGQNGDVICFGLEIFHEDQFICRAGECDNWSLVWTPRAGERFQLKFEPAQRGTTVLFFWQ